MLDFIQQTGMRAINYSWVYVESAKVDVLLYPGTGEDLFGANVLRTTWTWRDWCPGKATGVIRIAAGSFSQKDGATSQTGWLVQNLEITGCSVSRNLSCGKGKLSLFLIDRWMIWLPWSGGMSVSPKVVKKVLFRRSKSPGPSDCK